MPELVEVETFKRQLTEVLKDKQVITFNATNPRSIRRHKNEIEIKNQIAGSKVKEISRHGKYLSFEFENGVFLNTHLRMSGRFLCFKKADFNDSVKPKHTHIVLSTDSNLILFIDPRTFGEMWVTSDPCEESKSGLDAFESTIEQRLLELKKFSNSNRSLKSILLDQNILAGIGNIYADEICADARLQPTRKIGSLTKGELLRVVQCCGSVLTEAIQDRGSSLRDESFRDLNGEIGQFQLKHVVYAKTVCSRCNGQIEKLKVAGRTAYFCPKCQK